MYPNQLCVVTVRIKKTHHRTCHTHKVRQSDYNKRGSTLRGSGRASEAEGLGVPAPACLKPQIPVIVTLRFALNPTHETQERNPVVPALQSVHSPRQPVAQHRDNDSRLRDGRSATNSKRVFVIRTAQYSSDGNSNQCYNFVVICFSLSRCSD